MQRINHNLTLLTLLSSFLISFIDQPLLAQDFCEDKFTVTGFVKSCCDRPVEGAIVTIANGMTGNTTWVMTDQNGYYDLGCFDKFEDYEIIVSKLDNQTEGVNLEDLEIIQDHILAINQFSDPCQFIAADANGDGSVTSIDLVTIDQVIEGVSTFPNNISWRFFAPNLMGVEVYALNNYSFDALTLDWVGVKIGDVDCDDENWILQGDNICIQEAEEFCAVGQEEMAEVEYLFCEGDTAIFRNLLETDSLSGILVSTVSYQVFYPDMVTVLSSGPNFSQLYFGDEGQDCLCVEYTILDWSNGLTFFEFDCKSILVLNSSPLVINHNGSDQESITVCRGENFELTAELTNSVDLSWSSSDGQLVQGNTFSAEYDQAGIYQIVLEDLSECHCSTPDTIQVEVLNGDIPSITCLGTICEGDTATYYSGVICDTYLWSVSSAGNIIVGGDPDESFISIVWSGSPQGQVSLETPDCLESACSSTVSEDVNIITSTSTISGPTDVCMGDYSIYSLPPLQGVEFNWDVDMNGQIVSGQGTNIIQVEWNTYASNPVSTIIVNYESCTAGCNGSAALVVNLKPRFEIRDAGSQVCIDENVFISNSRWINLDWKIEFPDGRDSIILAEQYFSFDVKEEGTYTITAENLLGTTCNLRDTTEFQVISPPAFPIGGITGPRVICKKVPMEYSVPLALGEQVSWTFNDGSNVWQTNTNPAIYTWQSDGPYSIEVQLFSVGGECQGEAELFVFDNQIELSGSNEVCINSSSDFSIPNIIPTDIVWSIEPNTTGYIAGQQDDMVTVFWQEAGTHKLIGSLCGVSVEQIVTVLPAPIFDVSYPDEVCFGELGMVTVTNPPGSTIEVIDENQIVASTGQISLLKPGIYEVVLTDEDGCTDSTRIKFTERDSFGISIFSADDLSFCLPHPDVTLLAEVIQGSYDYQWYRDGAILSTAITPKYSTNIFGDYQLRLTDDAGCEVFSNILTLVENCGGPGGPGTSIPVDLTAGYIDGPDDDNLAECNNYEFSVDPTFASTSFTWYFDDPESGPLNSAVGLTATHVFTEVGYYDVVAFGNINNEIGRMQVRVPVMPDFTFEVKCLTDPVAFTDLSSFVPDLTGITYSWDFGDPASGADNVSALTNPQHLFSSPGTYDVSLFIEHTSGCTSIMTKQVEIIDYSTVSILTDTLNCQGNSLQMSFDLLLGDFEYLWVFDDPLSGNADTSELIKPVHVYNSPGTYEVTLTVTDIDDCSYQVTQEITIANNTLTGDITLTPPGPKCPEEVVTLTSPSPGNMYLWSTGETTQSISTDQSGIYNVTITNSDDCVYVPDPVTITNIPIDQLRICGTYYIDEIIPVTDCESLDLCSGESFTLSVEEYPGATYLWSTGHVTSTLDYAFLSSLPTGTHMIGVTVSLASEGCIQEIEPFEVNISPVPAPISISDNNVTPCAGEVHVLSINNPDSQLSYRWNTGERGTSIEVVGAGEYVVEGSNVHGCKTVSNTIVIHPLPLAPTWLTGCLEVCFPENYCLSLNEENTYQLLESGNPVSVISSTSTEVSIDKPGDYQIEVSNAFGCTTITDVLSLTATPDQQTLSGVVFIDDNNNEMYDAGETLLDSVEVLLLLGNTLLQQDTTDINGQYDFGEVNYSNLTVVIDTSGLDLTYSGAVDSLITFSNCIEDKLVDFPLTVSCQNSEEEMMLAVCPGEMVEYGGTFYSQDDLDTLRYVTATGCDSTIFIEVYAYPLLEFEYAIEPTCALADIGQFEIFNVNQENVSYVLDGDNIDSLTLTEMQLESGMHSLLVTTDEGCTQELEFEILEIDQPDILLDPESTCTDLAEGSLEIVHLSNYPVNIGLDPGQLSLGTSLFQDLPAGDYTLYVEDTLGCMYEYPFEISVFQEPMVQILAEESCENSTSGSLEVTVVAGDPMFSLDLNETFSQATTFDNLGDGNYQLYMLSEFGCLDSLPFVIGTFVEPSVDIAISNACEATASGAIEIESNNTWLTFSLDGTTFQSVAEFDNLNTGSYTLYYQTLEGCIYEEPFEIQTAVAPEVIGNSSMSCEDSEDGSLEITIVDGEDLTFEIEGVTNAQQDLMFENLGVGNYNLLITDTLGCQYNLPFEIEAYIEPIVDISSSGSCEQQNSGELSIATDDPLAQFAVDDFNYTNVLEFYDLAPGSHILNILSQSGCEYQMPFAIGAHATPEISINTEHSCELQSEGTLSIEELTGSAQYAVDDVTQLSDALIYEQLSVGDHMLYIMSVFGCLDSLPFIIESMPTEELDIDPISSCIGESSGGVVINNVSAFTNLMLDSEVIATSDSITGLEPGTYMLTGLDNNGCETGTAFTVDAHPALEVTWPDISVDCESTNLMIIPMITSQFGEASYDWNNGSQNSQLLASQNGTYAVTISDQCSQVSHAWEIEYVELLEEESVFAPNIFIGNGEAPNNCFTTGYPSDIELLTFHLIIFDRWGNLIFETDDPEDCWSGDFDNQQAESGVYVYINTITYLECDGVKDLKKVGDVTLIFN